MKIGRIDWPGVLMGAVTVLALSWVVWQRLPRFRPDPPALGKTIPALRLLDPITGEASAMPPLRGKVVWISFWSAASNSARADLESLEAIWTRFKSREKFAMAAVAIDTPKHLQSVLGTSNATLPTYLADPKTARAFGAEPNSLPLHLLLDETGRLIAIAKGNTELESLAEQAEARLELIEPPKTNRRFAFVPNGPQVIRSRVPRRTG